MADIPLGDALAMIKKGLSNEEITRVLEGKGYNLQQISDAINQANIKKGVEGNMPPENMQPSAMEEEIPLPPAEQPAVPAAAQPVGAPAQQAYYGMPAQAGPSYEEMQAIVEQIVEEKWRELVRNIGDINVFKARVGDDIDATKQEILRTQKRLEDLQVAVLGKVREYNQNVIDINNEMKALEQVFGKIIEPLTANVKELARVTEELKKKR